jgi:hypothetical protein
MGNKYNISSIFGEKKNIIVDIFLSTFRNFRIFSPGNFVFGLFIAALIHSLFSISRIMSSTAPDYNAFFVDLNAALGNETYIGVNPPFVMLNYLWFNLFPFRLSQGILIFFVYAAFVGSVYMSTKIIYGKVSVKKFALFYALSWFMFPTRFTLGMGQSNFFALFGLLLAYYFYKKDYGEISGILMGYAISYKVTFCFFLLYYLIKKKYKIVLFAGIFILLYTLISYFIFDPGIYTQYFQLHFPRLGVLIPSVGGWSYNYHQGFSGFVIRSFGNNNATRFISALFIPTIIIFVCKITEKVSKDLSFSLFIITLLLIDPTSWQHHFVWVLFPFFLVYKLLDGEEIKRIFILGLSYILLNIHISDQGIYKGLLYSLSLSTQFIGAVILFMTIIYKKTAGKTVV